MAYCDNLLRSVCVIWNHLTHTEEDGGGFGILLRSTQAAEDLLNLKKTVSITRCTLFLSQS